ncbi:MAG: MBG domain-containing protein [Acidimicrobiales bacterium]
MLALGTLVFVPSAYASDTVPRGPTGVVATPGNGSVIVRWRAPANDGGSAITGYVVRSSPGSKACKTTGAKACTIHGLKNGTTYTVGVRAHNQDGLGLASAHVRVQPGVPLTPKDVGATAGNAQATVTWAAPVTNGSAIRSYTVKSIPGSKTCTNHITTCTMTGLTNGTSYRFTVTATNARGTGASALSTLVTPHLPATLTITASDGSQTFGGLVPTITAVYSGFVDGDTPADLTTLPTCVSGTTSSSPVLGSYTSSCSGAVDPDYTIRYVDGTTTVVPATLTITANPEVKLVGAPDPALTFVVVGLFGTDTTTGSLTRAPGNTPGVYAIDQGTLTAGPNYTIVYVGSFLTVLI